jgi:hypothetical protein
VGYLKIRADSKHVVLSRFFHVQTLLLLKVIDFRSRMLAFRGACGEPPRCLAPLGVSPVPQVPQDKEGFNSVTSHEENVIFIFEESRNLRSNQLPMKRMKNDPKATIFREKLCQKT